MAEKRWDSNKCVRLLYVCSVKVRYMINGTEVCLNKGELLFLNQKVNKEDSKAGRESLVVEIPIMPEQLEDILRMMGEKKNLIQSFIIDCLKGNASPSLFLHFKVGDVLPVQNLIENLLWIKENSVPNKGDMQQVTMGLLFLHLMNCMDRMHTNPKGHQEDLAFGVLRYIEENYRNAKLNQLADDMHYDVYWVSKEIKRKTGMTYTKLLQEKRLNQAAYLLVTTSMSVLEISMAVGYDNVSYFHRIFLKKYGVTPRKYRVLQQIRE